MYYDLDTLEELCHELGFVSDRTSYDALYVSILDGVKLIFENLREEEDTVIGFEGVPSHSHDKMILMVEDDMYVELDELDVLMGIKSGDVLIAERYLDGLLTDRWLIHKDDKVDFKYMQPGEEVRYRRIP